MPQKSLATRNRESTWRFATKQVHQTLARSSPPIQSRCSHSKSSRSSLSKSRMIRAASFCCSGVAWHFLMLRLFSLPLASSEYSSSPALRKPTVRTKCSLWIGDILPQIPVPIRSPFFLSTKFVPDRPEQSKGTQSVYPKRSTGLQKLVHRRDRWDGGISSIGLWSPAS